MKNIIDGKIMVIKNKKDYYRIKDETILIVKNTTPDITIIINKIKAIVTEIDNKLCHAAIIAREFNIPLLMGINNVTEKFKTGDRVIIDFDNKNIEKIK
ncbi:MAG: PEP-utilizing enzyme [Candidatus Paceibacterota bacterium]|jgi:pyruvate,water dikinase